MNATANWVASLVAWRRRGQVVATTGPDVRVNLGSGLRLSPDWINLDGSVHALLAGAPNTILRLAHRFTQTNIAVDEYLRLMSRSRYVHHDLRYGLPFASESVDVAAMANILVYFDPDEADRLIQEAFRVLRRGGRLQITTADPERIHSLYREGRGRLAIDYLFGEVTQHRWHRRRGLYGLKMLSETASRIGFTRCIQRDEATLTDDELFVLNPNPELSLILEATK